ncbi:MAG: DEAD/DEAH box helicase [Fibrobacteria bacterium]|nr:DEAD/DEAH box helicase [Fibrobacteria bacterium]
MQKKKNTIRKPKLSRIKKPAHMTLEEWQTALRVQYGKEQNFKLKNLGEHPIYSNFSVSNPQTGKSYRVSIRGEDTGVNFCSCPDYAVNTLGVCKHIAFTLSRLKKKRRAKRLFREGYQPDYSEVYVKYGGQRTLMVSIGTSAPPSARKIYTSYTNKDGSLKPNGIRCFNAFLTKLRTRGHEVHCYDDALELVAQIRDNESRIKLINKKYGKRKSLKIKGISATLYPYQMEGVLFAVKAGRCIIADEMGLGKTIQAIAAAELFAEHFGVGRVLIVSPTSVKYQWMSEIEKFCRRSSLVIEGPLHKRKDQYNQNEFFSIASYEQIYRDVEYVNKAGFDLIILDETQRIKNWKTRTAQSIKELNSAYAIALTGTPLENRIEELHSIVSFIDRYRLGPLFKFLHAHEVHDEKQKVIGYKDLGSIGKTLEPVLIRRNKKLVQQQLPPRLEKNHFVAMTELQSEYHEENAEIAAKIAAKWARNHYLSEADQRRLMIALLRMRMACDDAYLVDKENISGHKVDTLKEVLGDALETEDVKVVIFSQWTTMHYLVAEMLNELGIGYVYLHGSVPAKKRRGLMEDFKKDPNIRVFLSTDAGQTGLNLQNASVIINMDLPWNPAILEQRIGRLHRIGQKRSVRVINFVARATIEHRMLEVLKFKKSVFGGVLDGGDNTVMMGESRLKKFMKEVTEITESLPETPPAEDSSFTATGQDKKTPDSAKEIKTRDSEEDGLSALIEAGSMLLSSLVDELRQRSDDRGSRKKKGNASFIETDKITGKQNLKIPLPPKDTMQKIASIAVPFLSRFLEEK